MAPLYVLRGLRELYDVTPKELQTSADILDVFYHRAGDYVHTLNEPNDDDNELRVALPFFLSAYYEAVAHMEQLRQNIVARKEREAEGFPELPPKEY